MNESTGMGDVSQLGSYMFLKTLAEETEDGQGRWTKTTNLSREQNPEHTFLASGVYCLDHLIGTLPLTPWMDDRYLSFKLQSRATCVITDPHV
jgi:hypothetical protein